MRRIRDAGLAPGRKVGHLGRAAAAAVLFLALSSPLFWRTPEPVEPSWNGATVRAGDSIRLRGGDVRFQFAGRAEAMLRGPAALDVVADDHATLREGALTIRVLPSALPFRVSARGLDVTSRGSEFGIGTDVAGTVRLSVLEGEILASSAGDLPQTIRLTREESLRRDGDGTLTANILGAGFPFPRLGSPHDPRLPALSNGSFEVPRTAPSGALAAAGWTLAVYPRANAENMDIEAGAGATAAGLGTPPAAEGRQWGYLNARTFPDGRRYTTSMHQAVGPVVAGGTYEIDLTVGRTAETHWASLVVGLYSGSPDEGPETPLREWVDPVRLAPRQSAPARLVYTCPVDSLDAGRTLFLRLATSPAVRPGLSRILVDDIRLSLRLPDERKSR
jgi:hypothetical protein